MIHKYIGGAEMNTLSANINDKRCLRTRLAIKSALLSLLEDKPLAKITAWFDDSECGNLRSR